MADSPCQRAIVTTISLRLAIILYEHVAAVVAAGARQGASAILATDPLSNAMEENNGDAMHSRFVGQETDLICNHKFV